MDKKVQLNVLILEAHNNYLRKFNKLWKFLVLNKSLFLQNAIIENNENISTLLNSIRPNLLDDIRKIEDDLNISDKNIDSFYDELMFKNNYQFFEEFLFEVFCSLYKIYPAFLKKIDTNFDYRIIFEENNIENLKSYIIEKKVKTLIQSNNILNTLKQLKIIFGIELKLEKDILNKLYILSKVRNILTHNNGVVNDLFIDDMKLYNIKHEYFVGQTIYNEIKIEKKSLFDLSEKVINQIITQINSSSNQIEKYSLSVV